MENRLSSSVIFSQDSRHLKSLTWKIWRPCHLHVYVQAIRGIGSSSIQEHQCFETWNSEKEEWQRHHTLQSGCFKHRALVPNHSFCKSAQYLRSSVELVWTIRLDRGKKGTRNTERIRDTRCIDKFEMTRSKTFGIFSKTSIWKQFAGNHSRLRLTVRDSSVQTGFANSQRSGTGSQLVWSTKTRPDEDDGFGQIIPLCREYTLFSNKPTIRSLCSNSWRNNYWTQFHHPMIQSGQPMVLFLRERVGSWMEVHIPNAELRSSAETLWTLESRRRRI